MMKLSPATELAWQAAADEAMHLGSAEIEPHHLLIGIYSVEKFLNLTKGEQGLEADSRRAEVQREVHEWAEAATEAKVDSRTLRRALRATDTGNTREHEASSAGKIRRSAVSQQTFARAETLAENAGAVLLRLVHLGVALLSEPDNKIESAFSQLGKQPADLRLVLLRRAELSNQTGSLVEGAGQEFPAMEIAESLDASRSPYPLDGQIALASRRTALLHELPLLFGSGRPVGELLQETLKKIQLVIPAASHAALLVRDRETGELLLLAHVPMGGPKVSTTLANNVMESKSACIWIRGQQELTASLDRYGVHSGIYAPLIWQKETLGVFAVSSGDSKAELNREDLKLIVALAHHAAMALANARLQNDLRQKNELLERMLTNFSPRVRGALLDKASRGALRLGGEKSEVTILCSDVRGFTKTSEKLSTDQIVDLLNDYFSGLVDAIFRYDGTIDKFLGDGILAVFGSPERDTAQHEKALRAAMAMQEAMRQKNQARGARGMVTCEIGIGLHCGEVFHGFIGTTDRMEFTVIGDAVNRTARYCAGAQGGQILLSPLLFQRTWKLADVRPTKIDTKHEGEFEAYELNALKS
jgi:adenylate cyclase